MTRSLRPVLASAALVLSALTLAGCSAAAGSSAGSSAIAPAPAPAPDLGSTARSEGGAADGSAAAGSVKSSGASASTVDRSIVITGTITITADEPIAASARAVELVEAAGGRVDGRTETAATDGDRGSATLVLRIPVAKLNSVVAQLKKLGRADQVELDSADVTTQTQDLGARIDALRTTITRLLELEGKATDTTNLIAIETAIGDRQGELESLEAQQRGLADQVSMSTVTLNLRSDAAAPPVKPADFWAGLGTGWKAFTGFWAGALVVLGVVLPWLALIGVGLLLALLARRIVRARAKRAGGVTADPSQPAA